MQQHRCLCNGNDELVLRIGEHVKARELSFGQVLLHKTAKRCLGIALNQQVKVVFRLNQLTLLEMNSQASQQNPRVIRSARRIKLAVLVHEVVESVLVLEFCVCECKRKTSISRICSVKLQEFLAICDGIFVSAADKRARRKRCQPALIGVDCQPLGKLCLFSGESLRGLLRLLVARGFYLGELLYKELVVGVKKPAI